MSAVAQALPLEERRSSLPLEMAHSILAGFDRHYRLFREAARQAKALYERAAWREMRALSQRRMLMYDERVQEAVAALRERFPQAARDESLWSAVKQAYIGLLQEHKQPECAETFYNSVACEVLHRRHYRNEFIFWRPAIATEHLEGERPTYNCYYPLRDGLRRTLRSIARSFELKNRWEDPARDLRNVVHALRRQFPRPARAQPDLQIQVVSSLFFRNKGAYVVGRLVNASEELPFAVPILQNERGELYLDALLVGEDALLVLFSFARAYFFVDSTFVNHTGRRSDERVYPKPGMRIDTAKMALTILAETNFCSIAPQYIPAIPPTPNTSPKAQSGVTAISGYKGASN